MKVDDEVLTALGESTTNGSALFLGDQLDRKLYVRVAKVIECMGGKWNKGAKAHLFSGQAEELLQSVLATGEVLNKQAEFGFFQTPEVLAANVCDRADLSSGATVLEPSAGLGALAAKVYHYHEVDLHCIDLLQEHCVQLIARFPKAKVYQGNFLAATPKPVFDRIVMNPPFGKQQDIAHVSHALGFLKPMGKLVAIMSAGVKFRQDKTTVNFRGLIFKHGGTIEDLPEGSFKCSGTSVNTVLVEVNT